MCHAKRFDFLVPTLILFTQVVVNGAIHVHRQIQFFAVKIHDALAKWTLAIEVVTAQLLSLEPIPKQHFGKRHYAAQGVSTLRQVGAIWNDGLAHASHAHASMPDEAR